MRPISYARATKPGQAISLVTQAPGARFLAGGTTMIDLIRLNVEQPSLLIDINHLPLKAIEETQTGVRIGALAHMEEVARSPLICERYPMLSQALLLGASTQLRNLATIGGNLLQRTRCSYFRDATSPCNKRSPGSGCSALGGDNRTHAILGTSEHCIAVHPSDMAVALLALDAVILTSGPNGERTIPLADFHLLPAATPHKETALLPGELLVAVEIPTLPFLKHSLYLKIRDRESYEFALVSVAAALDLHGQTIRNARLALGGVGTKPWRNATAEKILLNQPANEANFAQAAAAAVDGAVSWGHNEFKIILAQRAVVRALSTLATGGAA